MAENVYKGYLREVLLGDIADIRTARRPERVEDYQFDSSFPYMNIQALESGKPNKFAEGGTFITEKRDLVIVKDGYRSGKVFYAKEGVAASTLAILTPMSNNVLQGYLYCYLSFCFDDFQSRLRGIAIGHLDMNYLRKLIIPLPDLTKQNEIAKKYQRLEKQVEELKAKSSRLKELSISLGNVDLKKNSEKLNEQVATILKSWLHQIFKKTV